MVLTGWDSLSAVVVMALTGSMVWLWYEGNEIDDSYKWKFSVENNHQTKKDGLKPGENNIWIQNLKTI